MLNIFEMDKKRYKDKKCSELRFIKLFRKAQASKNKFGKSFYKLLMVGYKNRHMIEMSVDTKIGGGFYIGHPCGITINPNTVIGNNVNIHKGVTLGQENRGRRKGAPVIGNNVWIGINTTVVGNVTIGNDVLIAPNSFVNRDIPDHSVVFGNPCQIKAVKDATADYIEFFD